MKFKILLTGCEGFIGSNLKTQFKGKINFLGIDLEHGFSIFDEELETEIQKVDIVIHLAALTSVEKSFKKPNDYFYTNVLGTARVAQLCMKYNKKLIFPSSAAVKDPTSSPYALSKALGEQIVSKVPNSVILRLYNVYGENMSPENGSIMYNFLHSRKLIVYGDGQNTRDYINVKDVCSIIEASFKWKGLVEVGTGHTYTVNHIAKLFSKYRGINIEYKLPREEIKHSISDTKLLKKLYKKKLITNIEKDIYDLCQN